jgi:hypothetical protein
MAHEYKFGQFPSSFTPPNLHWQKDIEGRTGRKKRTNLSQFTLEKEAKRGGGNEYKNKNEWTEGGKEGRRKAQIYL